MPLKIFKASASESKRLCVEVELPMCAASGTAMENSKHEKLFVDKGDPGATTPSQRIRKELSPSLTPT